MTGDKKEKPDKGSIDKKPLNLDGKLKKKRYFEKKVIDEKLLDPERVLEGKLTPYDWGLKGRKSWFRHETWKLKGRSLDKDWLEVTCSHVQSYAMRLRMSSLELPEFVQKYDKNQTQLSSF